MTENAELQNKIESLFEHAIDSLNKCKLDESIDTMYNMLLIITDDDINFKTYDYLYCLINDKLIIYRQLINKFPAEDKDLPYLYEIAQMKSRALPRCYLMTIIAYSIINFKLETIENITKDLNNYCNSIQNPIKGLYLRRFLIENVLAIKHVYTINVIPILTDFLLFNFRAINKLWIKITKTFNINNKIEIFNKLTVIIHFCFNKLAELIDLNPHIELSIVRFIIKEIKICGCGASQIILIEYLVSLINPECLLRHFVEIFQSIQGIKTEYDKTHFIKKFSMMLNNYLNDKSGEKIKYFINIYLANYEFLKIESENPAEIEFCVFDSILRIFINLKFNDILYINNIFNSFYNFVGNSNSFEDFNLFNPLTALINSHINIYEILGFGSFLPMVKKLKPPFLIDIFILICEKFKSEFHDLKYLNNSKNSEHLNFHLIFELYIFTYNQKYDSYKVNNFEKIEPSMIEIFNIFLPINIEPITNVFYLNYS